MLMTAAISTSVKNTDSVFVICDVVSGGVVVWRTGPFLSINYYMKNIVLVKIKYLKREFLHTGDSYVRLKKNIYAIFV